MGQHTRMNWRKEMRFVKHINSRMREYIKLYATPTTFNNINNTFQNSQHFADWLLNKETEILTKV